MIKEINEMLKAAVDDEELIPNIAKAVRKIYTELLKQGFTSSEALQIVTSMSGKKS